MGCGLSYERLKILRYTAECRNNEFVHSLNSYKRNSFIRCNKYEIQCRNSISEVGGLYCNSCIKNKTLYKNHIKYIIMGNWIPRTLLYSYNSMISANIEYVEYKEKRDKQYIKLVGIEDSHKFISNELVNIGIIPVLEHLICQYLDFTPEFIVVCGTTKVKILYGIDTHIISAKYRAFVYNHEWQCFIGINNMYLSYDTIGKVDPTFSKFTSTVGDVEFTGNNYCILDNTSDINIVSVKR